MRFLVMIRRTSTGYSADIPDLPGCIATGTTVEQTRQMITEAAEMHTEMMLQGGETIPQPASHLDFSVDDDSAEEFCTWIEVEPVQAVSP